MRRRFPPGWQAPPGGRSPLTRLGRDMLRCFYEDDPRPAGPVDEARQDRGGGAGRKRRSGWRGSIATGPAAPSTPEGRPPLSTVQLRTPFVLRKTPTGWLPFKLEAPATLCLGSLGRDMLRCFYEDDPRPAGPVDEARQDRGGGAGRDLARADRLCTRKRPGGRAAAGGDETSSIPGLLLHAARQSPSDQRRHRTLRGGRGSAPAWVIWLTSTS